jgi:protein-disulfide isomerase
MTSEGSRKISFEISKTTVVVGLILLVLGYFIGNTIPVGNYFQSNPKTMITNTVGSSDLTSKKVSSSINLEIPSFAKFRGSESAKINMVEFGDYQCPFCEKFFQYTEPQLKKDYIDAGKVKFYFLDFVIVGQDSLTLTEGSWCADEQGKYYEYHDYVYSNQGQENSGWGTPDKVKAFAKNIGGLDVQKFSDCLDSKKYYSRAQDLTQIGQNIGITGTPTAFIGNEQAGYTKITGAQPYSVYQEAIDSLH